jgi:hypothetical protein
VEVGGGRKGGSRVPLLCLAQERLREKKPREKKLED